MNAQWTYVDLGTAKSIDSVTIVWGTPHATSFEVQTWSNNANWPPPYQATGGGTWQTTSAGTQAGTDGTQTIRFDTVTAELVRVDDGKLRSSGGAYAIAELTVSGGGAQVSTNANSTSQSAVTVSSTDPRAMDSRPRASTLRPS